MYLISVEKLQNHPDALCAGSSEIYVWFNELGKMYQFGPYGPNHATAGTFAFKKQLLKDHRYDNNAALAEEKAFLKNYTVPFVQLDPVKTILVFSHAHNTFDKRKLLENPHPDYVRVSDKTVDTFIPNESADLKEFYTKEILTVLKEYEPGKPEMKPDVIQQTKEIEQKRQEEAQKRAMQAGNSNISVTMTDGTQKMLSNEEVINIIKTQQTNVQELERIVGEKDNECKRLQALNNLLLKRLREATEALQNAQNMQPSVNNEPELSYEKPVSVPDNEEVKSENITLSIEEKPVSEQTQQPNPVSEIKNNTSVSTPAFVEPTDADVIIEELFK